MLRPLQRTVETAFGLAFDVRQDSMSGELSPAPHGAADGKALFSEIRLEGFALLLKLGFAKRLVVVGTDQTKYQNQGLAPLYQPDAIKQMLVQDFAVEYDRVECLDSGSNTAGNMAAIKEWSAQNGQSLHKIAVVSNHYHLVRAGMYLQDQGILVQQLPAEAFVLIDEPSRKAELIRYFGDGPLVERMVEEIQGAAHWLCGVSRPRLDNGEFRGK